MTDRIQNAIDALDKATPGEWIFDGSDIYSADPNVNFGAICYGDGQLGYAEDGNTDAADANTKLLVTSKDLAAEVIRLRKWQSEAVEMLKNENLYLYKGSLSEKEYQINLDTIDRLIAEAEGE